MVAEKSFCLHARREAPIATCGSQQRHGGRCRDRISCRTHVGPLRVSPPATASHQASIWVSQEIQKVLNLSCWKSCAGSDGGQQAGQYQAPSVEPVCNLSSPENTRRKNSIRFGIMSLIFSRSPSGIRSR